MELLTTMRKMKLFFLILPIIICIFVSKVCYADVISWEEGVQEAADANAELKAAKSSLLSSRYKVNGARSGFFPFLKASAVQNYDSTSSPHSYSLSLNASENLFSGFSDTAKIDLAKTNESLSEVNLVSIKSKISFDLKKSFMGLLYSQKNIILTEDIIKRREANLKLVQLRFENGRENIGSLHLSKAYLAQAKYDHLQAVNSVESYQSELARVLGREDFNSLEVKGRIPSPSATYESKQKVDYKNLIKNIPEYKKSFFNEQKALASLDLSHSAFYPSLNLTQSVSRTARESNPPKNDWIVGAVITFDLFNGGLDYYTSKSYSEDYRASTHIRKNTEETSITNLKQAFSSYLEATMKLEVDQAFSLASSSRERIAKAQYNNGLITFIDWDLIENDLIIRQKTLLQTEKESIVAEAAWEQVQGKGVIP